MLDFAVAKTWHKDFSLHAEFVVDRVGQAALDAQSVSADCNCDLGRWIYGRGQRYSSLSAYADLIEKHKYFHRTTSLMLREHELGNSSAAQLVQFSSFRVASDAVLASIDRLASSVALLSQPMTSSLAASDKGAEELWIWQEGLREGLEFIDLQHVELVNYVERLNADPQASSTSELFGECKFAINKLAALHFETEELFMKEVEFPEQQVLEHFSEHNEVLESLLQIDVDGMMGRARTAAEVYRQVRDRLHDHILSYDGQFRAYVSNPALLLKHRSRVLGRPRVKPTVYGLAGLPRPCLRQG